MNKVIPFLLLTSICLQSDEMTRFDVVYDDENRHYLVYIPKNDKKKITKIVIGIHARANILFVF